MLPFAREEGEAPRISSLAVARRDVKLHVMALMRREVLNLSVLSVGEGSVRCSVRLCPNRLQLLFQGLDASMCIFQLLLLAPRSIQLQPR